MVIQTGAPVGITNTITRSNFLTRPTSELSAPTSGNTSAILTEMVPRTNTWPNFTILRAIPGKPPTLSRTKSIKKPSRNSEKNSIYESPNLTQAVKIRCPWTKGSKANSPTKKSGNALVRLPFFHWLSACRHRPPKEAHKNEGITCRLYCVLT